MDCDNRTMRKQKAHKYTQSNKSIPGPLTRICEICGREGLTEYMYAIGASWQVTGHHMVPAFSCQTEPSAQHWGCTPKHALEALLICLMHDEHMSITLLKYKHEQAKSEGKPSVAPEHAKLVDKMGGGDEWHFALIDKIKSSM
jgi:hypothetical protein